MISPLPNNQQPSRFESQSGSEVVELSPKGLGSVCEQQYEGMVADFKGLFALCLPANIPPNRAIYQMDITLSRHKNDEIDTYATIQATSRFPEAVDYRQADGFKILEEKTSRGAPSTTTATHMFSLGHNGCREDQSMYSEDSWTLDRAKQAKNWLNKNLLLSRNMLIQLVTAASDPGLNPELASNIQEKQFIDITDKETYSPIVA